jgi:DoxX-like family
MPIAYVVTSIVLAALMTFAAVRKLGHREDVVATYTRVGVPEDKLDYLAFVLLAGAAGLLAGLAWAPIGVVAAAGTVAYFLLAVAAHVRHDDRGNLPTPVAIELIALAALALRLMTL